MVTGLALFEYPDLTASRIQEREDQLRRTTCDLRIRVAKNIEVEVEFRAFIVNCNYFCRLCVKICHLSVKLKFIKLTISDLSFFITIHKAFVFVDSYSSISVTIRNKKHVLWEFSCNDQILSPPEILAFLPESPCVVIFVLFTHACTYILYLNTLAPVWITAWDGMLVMNKYFEWIDEGYQQPHSEQPGSRLRFSPGTSRMRRIIDSDWSVISGVADTICTSVIFRGLFDMYNFWGKR